MRITETISKCTQEFDDATDFSQYVQSPIESTLVNSSEQKDRDAWSGNASLADAYRMMDYGWPEGVEIVRKFSANITNRVTGYLREPVIQYDVTGDYIDMGRYVTGEPEVFGGWVESEVDRDSATPKIIRIVANLTVSAAISHETIALRGAGLVALIDALESQGKRVEVDLVFYYSRGNELLQRIRVKESHHPLQLDKMAYLLCHASVFRRLSFRAAEHCSDEFRRRGGFYTGGGYGMQADVPQEERGDIYLPKLTSDTDWTFDATLEWVLRTLEQCGVTVEPNEQERELLRKKHGVRS